MRAVRRAIVPAVLAAAGACSSFDSSGTGPPSDAGADVALLPGPDAGAPDSAPSPSVDAGDASTCDLTKGELTITPLTALNTPDAGESSPALTADESVIIFVSTASTFVDPNGSLVLANRNAAGSFDPPSAALTGALNQAGRVEASPLLSPDGLGVTYYRIPPGGGHEMVFADRDARNLSFRPPAQVRFVLADAGTFELGSKFPASFSLTTSAIYLNLQLPNPNGGRFVFRAFKRTGGLVYAEPVVVEAGGPVKADGAVVNDAETLMFVSKKPTTDSPHAVFVAKRALATDPWGPLAAVPVLNDAFATWLSPDGCRLYFSRSSGVIGSDLYVATRR